MKRRERKERIDVQSQIEGDEDLSLKFNCKGKKTVGKANKGINVEKYNKFKILNYKKEKRKRKKWKKTEKRGKKENSTKLQKPNIEAEVYNNNKKCD